MKYRPEIDGLRAIAVLPVIFYHAGFQWFSGGFIGVDVFFVISGYLITSIILCDLDEGKFSFAHFYERRVRRIFPALFFILLCTIPPAWFLLAPSHLETFAQSIISSVLFVSNVFFWSELSYFAPAADRHALIHTWSLSIEEQFYLFFPLLLWGLQRFKLPMLYLVLALGLCSLALCLYGIHRSPSATFFLLPTRIWELCAGSLCAFWLFRRAPIDRPWLAMLGLMMIIGGMVGLHSAIPFPSHYTLLPVIGSMLIIVFAAPNSIVCRCLSCAPLVGIGLISYSAYLWHQPVFVFARELAILPLSDGAWLGLIVVSLGLAFLSWRYVERPFRQRGNKAIRTKALYFAAAGTASALIAISAFILWHQGLPQRTSPSGDRFSQLDFETRYQASEGLCLYANRQFHMNKQCIEGATPQLLLWGDSFAQHLAPGLKRALSNTGFYQAALPACAPILDFTMIGAFDGAQSCLQFNRDVVDWLSRQPHIHTVVLSASFPQLWSSNHYFLETEQGRKKQGSKQLLSKAMRHSLQQLHAMGKRVIIIAPPPMDYTSHHYRDIGKCLRKTEFWGRDAEPCSFNYNPEIEAFLTQFEGLASVIHLHPLLCRNGHCQTHYKGLPVYRDHGHLNIAASQQLIPDALTANGITLGPRASLP